MSTSDYYSANTYFQVPDRRLRVKREPEDPSSLRRFSSHHPPTPSMSNYSDARSKFEGTSSYQSFQNSTPAIQSRKSLAPQEEYDDFELYNSRPNSGRVKREREDLSSLRRSSSHHPPTPSMNNYSDARSKFEETSSYQSFQNSTPAIQSRKSLTISSTQDQEDSDFEPSNSKLLSVLISPLPRPSTLPQSSKKGSSSWKREDNFKLSTNVPISGSVVCLPPDVEIEVRKKCGRCKNKATLNASQIAALQRHEEVTVYCGTHLKSAAIPGASALLPDYLSLPAKLILKEKMCQPISEADGPGFIYIYESLDSSKKTVKLSVGRVRDPSKKARENDWIQYCGGKAIELYLYPEGRNGGIPKRRSDCQAPLNWSHRVEELVRIELVDIMQSKAYLDPAFPHCAYDYRKETPHDTGYFTTCDSCGKRHTEVYQFARLDGGQEWEVIIKPIIEKWAQFVNGD